MEHVAKTSIRPDEWSLRDFFTFLRPTPINRFSVAVSDFKHFVDTHGISIYKDLLDEFHPTVLHSFWEIYDLVKNNKEDSTRMEEDILFISGLGVKYLEVEVIGGADVDHLEESEMDMVNLSLRKLATLGREKGVHLAILFKDRSLAKSLGSTRRLFAKLWAEPLRLVIDPKAAELICQIDPQMVYSCFKDRVVAVVETLAEGEFDYPEFHRYLDGRGFRGHWSLPMDNREEARNSIKQLKHYWAGIKTDMLNKLSKKKTVNKVKEEDIYPF